MPEPTREGMRVKVGAGPSTERIDWVDEAKGLAISLVVLGHVLGGALARHWLTPEQAWRGFYDFLYLFHMPVFFAISGFLLVDGARRRPVQTLVSRVGSILWPYLFWDVLLRWSLLPFIGRFMGAAPQQVSFSELIGQALHGELSWFFWTLFLVQALFIALSFLPTSAILIVSIAAYVGSAGWKIGTLQAAVDFMPYLTFGAAVGGAGMRQVPIPSQRVSLAIGVLIFAALGLAVGLGLIGIRAVKLLCGFAGVAAVVLVLQSLRCAPLKAWLAALGTASLAIYVLHPYWQGGVRAVLQIAGLQQPFAQVVLQSVLAIAGSFAMWSIIEWLHLGWVFRLPLKQWR